MMASSQEWIDLDFSILVCGAKGSEVGPAMGDEHVLVAKEA